MNYTESYPSALYTIETFPEPELIMLSPVETFLTVNALDISPAVRAKVLGCIAKGAYRAAVELVPDFLQEAFRRIVNEAAYQRRNAGKYIDPDADYMPTAGKADPRQSKNSRL